MGDRPGVGVRLAVRRRGMFVATVIMGLACVLGFRGDATERGAGRALDHHVTVFNGRVVGSAFMIADGIAVTRPMSSGVFGRAGASMWSLRARVGAGAWGR